MREAERWVVVDGANVCHNSPEDPHRASLVKRLNPDEARKLRPRDPSLTLLRSVLESLRWQFEDHRILVAMDHGTWNILLSRAGHGDLKTKELYERSSDALEAQLLNGFGENVELWVLPKRSKAKAVDASFLSIARQHNAPIVSGDGFANMVSQAPWLRDWAAAGKILYATAAGSAGWAFTPVDLADTRPKNDKSPRTKPASKAAAEDASKSSHPAARSERERGTKRATATPASSAVTASWDAAAKPDARGAAAKTAQPAAPANASQPAAPRRPEPVDPDELRRLAPQMRTQPEREAVSVAQNWLSEHVAMSSKLPNFKSYETLLNYIINLRGARVFIEGVGLSTSMLNRLVEAKFGKAARLNGREWAGVIAGDQERFAQFEVVRRNNTGFVVLLRPSVRLERFIAARGDSVPVGVEGCLAVLAWTAVDVEHRSWMLTGEGLPTNWISAVVAGTSDELMRQMWDIPGDKDAERELRQRALSELGGLIVSDGAALYARDPTAVLNFAAQHTTLPLDQDTIARPETAATDSAAADDSTLEAAPSAGQPVASPAASAPSPPSLEADAAPALAGTAADTPLPAPRPAGLLPPPAPGAAPVELAGAVAASDDTPPAGAPAAGTVHPPDASRYSHLNIRFVDHPGEYDSEEYAALDEIAASLAAANPTTLEGVVAHALEHPAAELLLANAGIQLDVFADWATDRGLPAPTTAETFDAVFGHLSASRTDGTAERIGTIRCSGPDDYWVRWMPHRRLIAYLDEVLAESIEARGDGWVVPPQLGVRCALEWLQWDREMTARLDSPDGCGLGVFWGLQGHLADTRYRKALSHVQETLPEALEWVNSNTEDPWLRMVSDGERIRYVAEDDTQDEAVA